MIDFADFIVKQPLAFPNRPGTHNRTAVSPSGPPARSKRAAPKKPLSNMAMTAVMRRMEKGEFTVHGFRSSFRDWAAECTGYAHEVAEMALAHSIENKVERAYRRGDLFEKRRRLIVRDLSCQFNGLGRGSTGNSASQCGTTGMVSLRCHLSPVQILSVPQQLCEPELGIQSGAIQCSAQIGHRRARPRHQNSLRRF